MRITTVLRVEVVGTSQVYQYDENLKLKHIAQVLLFARAYGSRKRCRFLYQWRDLSIIEHFAWWLNTENHCTHQGGDLVGKNNVD